MVLNGAAAAMGATVDVIAEQPLAAEVPREVVNIPGFGAAHARGINYRIRTADVRSTTGWLHGAYQGGS